MHRIFLTTLLFCSLICSAAAQTTQTPAPPVPLRQLLDLPAPAPVGEKTKNEYDESRLKERPAEFYAPENVPPDDAPIEELIAYWAAQGRLSLNWQGRARPQPSEKTVERILQFCEEKDPFAMMRFFAILSPNEKTVETVKRIYDNLPKNERTVYLAPSIKNWLMYNSTQFIDELAAKAESVRDKDRYVTNQGDLLALARLDWERAAPILERLAGDNAQPVSRTLAHWAYYSRAIGEENEADITKYRRLLQETVENRGLSAGHRDLAMDALVLEKEWDGREDWYLSLLEDETLYNLESYTGLTTILRVTPPEKMIPAMARLVDSRNPAARRAAIRNLVAYVREGRVEAVRALLPWLSNPGWMSEIAGGRRSVIAALGAVDLPETVPALINILTNEEEYRETAAEALARYKDPRAVPALKMVLSIEKVNSRRGVYIRALEACGGLGDDEKMDALELYAATISTPEGAQKFYRELYPESAENAETTPAAMPVALNVGHYVSEQTEPSDGLVVRAVERLKKLRKTRPEMAAALSGIMQKWRGRVIFLEKLRQIRAGEADLETILSVIAQRREILEKVGGEVLAMRAGSGLGRGLAACLAEDAADLRSVLGQRDADAQIAVFGCARLLRLRLPVDEAGALLKSPNKLLALAAERYLESEDGVEARTLVLAHRPNEAVILGARGAFIPDAKNVVYNEWLRQIFLTVSGRNFAGLSFPGMDKNEESLRAEIKSNPELLAVYALLTNRAAGHQIIRVFRDKATLTVVDDPARYRERILTAKEYEDFYRLVIEEKIDTAVSGYDYCEICEPAEFVMFGRGGGRRHFFLDPTVDGVPVKRIFERFKSLDDGRLRLRYRLGEKIKGLEVVLADDKFPVRAVWKNGGDLRVLVEDLNRKTEIAEEIEREVEAKRETDGEQDFALAMERANLQDKRWRESKYAHFSWRAMDNGRLGAVAAQPAAAPYLFDETQAPESADYDTEPRAWQVRTADGFEIKASHQENSGLYKVGPALPPSIFKEGNYDFPLVTPDGRWVVAMKYGDGRQSSKAVRIDLRTGGEFPIAIEPAETLRPLAFIAAQNRILLYRAKNAPFYKSRPKAGDEEETEELVKPSLPAASNNVPIPAPDAPEYYLVDAATGAAQLVKGEFRPLDELTYRPLQPAGAAGVFWAAVYDRKSKETTVGRYDTKTFSFQPATRLPEIKLNSMDVWVDEKEAKIYFVYQGHLLAAPLENPAK